MLQYITHDVWQVVLGYQFLAVAEFCDSLGHRLGLLRRQFQSQFIEVLNDIRLTRVLTQRILTMSAETLSYMVSTSYGLKPIASVKVEIDGKEYEDQSSGDGQYDAFVKALRNIYKVKLGKTFPKLDNYQVTIPPGGRTDALVQTVITWREGDRIWRTRGLDADQTEAAIKATLKMINMYEADKSDDQAVSPRNLDME